MSDFCACDTRQADQHDSVRRLFLAENQFSEILVSGQGGCGTSRHGVWGGIDDIRPKGGGKRERGADSLQGQARVCLDELLRRLAGSEFF